MPQFVTVTVTTYCEGEAMDCDFAIWQEGEFYRVGLKSDREEGMDVYFDELDTYPEALAFALEGHGETV